MKACAIDPVELLVEFEGETSAYLVCSQLGLDLRHAISEKTCIPFISLVLSINGTNIEDQDVIPPYSTTRVTIRQAIVGGKGGFGALLRIKAREAGAKKTTDFGACRDLSGRRLRHVNDEILLQKWKEAKDSGKEFDVTQPTQSGLDLWFLSTPSWTSGFGKKKAPNKGRKSRLCSDWLMARESRSPPEGSPSWWGCPRGRRCQFAHGEDDLQEAAAAALREQKDAQSREQERVQRDSYVGSVAVTSGESGEAAIEKLVQMGLKAAKRKRTIEDELSESEAAEPGKETDSPNSFFNWEWIEVLSGEASLDNHEIIGLGEFSTVAVMPNLTLPVGTWFFEVELISAGLFQIGWGNEIFRKSVASAGDGTGDDSHSWAFDGLRCKLWHKDSIDYGQFLCKSCGQVDSAASPWNVGDVVGCVAVVGLCDTSAPADDQTNRLSVTLSYFLNGKCLGQAFQFDSSTGYFGVGLFPAISLNADEKMYINIGQTPFKYPPNTMSVNCLSCTASKFPDKISSRNAVNDSFISAIPLFELYANFHRLCMSTQRVEGISKLFVPIDLESREFETIHALEELGLDRLKAELSHRGLKAGGTLAERAGRLLSVRGIAPDKIDPKLKQKIK